MSEATFYEVQRLLTEGDRAGHWETMSPNSRDRASAEDYRSQLREEFPGVAFRTVPFGTGPNGRPGDVNERGNIISGDHVGLGLPQINGTVWVSAEQAENAALFGWKRNGIALWPKEWGENADRLVQVERAAPVDTTAGGDC